MRRRSKYEHYVFSVYSSVLGNYGAELHVIGTCNVYKDKIDPENLVPYIIPQRVELKNNVFSRLLVLGECYLQAFSKYLKTLKERNDNK